MDSASIFTRVSVFSVAFLLMGHAISDESPPTLARFVDGDYSLQKLIEFPDVDGDVTATVYCSVAVLGSGGLTYNICYFRNSDNKPFYNAVRTAIKSARASPAIVNGDERHVILYYRVIFLQKDGVARVGVYSNWGHDVEKYGLSYESPQMYTHPLSPPAVCRSKGTFAYLVVGANGMVMGDVVTSLWESKHGKICTTDIGNYHEAAKYIPGHSGDGTIEATYVKAWGVWK